MAIEFFTEDFRNDGYDSGLNSAFQGQLSSSYTNALSGVLQANSDWLGFLAKTVNGLTTTAALEVKALVDAGSFSLSGLFSAAQSKTGEVDGNSITDPQPMLTVTLADSTVVTIDLRAILSDLDTETWTQADTTGGGKKTVTTTTFHTREFYTDADQPEGYTDDWSDEDPDPGQGQWVSDTLSATFTKDGSSSLPDDTYAYDFNLLGDQWQNVQLTVTGQGDYDHANEGVTLTGDVAAGVFTATVTGPDNGNAADDQIGPEVFNVELANYADGDVAGTVQFSNQVSPSSEPEATVTLTLTYEYWVA